MYFYVVERLYLIVPVDLPAVYICALSRNRIFTAEYDPRLGKIICIVTDKRVCILTVHRRHKNDIITLLYLCRKCGGLAVHRNYRRSERSTLKYLCFTV